MMPLIAARQSIRGRPPRALGGGVGSFKRIGSMRHQSSSLTSQRATRGLFVGCVRHKRVSPDVEGCTS